MGNCCGPFKRGQPAKATNPKQQCFVDCCGGLCPPDNCCESISLYFDCGCNCDCEFNGYNFNGLKFKKKKKKNKKKYPLEIPSFSKNTLSANGFTFAESGLIPSVPSSSSSSSSSCECAQVKVDLTTDGCCLYLAAGGIESVGKGTVRATYPGLPVDGNIFTDCVDPDNTGLCQVTTLLNGSVDSTEVEDGDLIEVEVVSLLGNFKCCETQRDCNYQAPAMWIQKSNKDRKTVTLNKEALLKKVKFAAERVRGKRPKKRS